MVTVQGESATPGASPENLGAPVASADSQSLGGTAGQPAAVGSSGPAASGTGTEAALAKGTATPGIPVLLLASLVGLVVGVGLVSLRLAGRSAVRRP